MGFNVDKERIPPLTDEISQIDLLTEGFLGASEETQEENKRVRTITSGGTRDLLTL
jgi:hypothetical protein